MAQKIPNHMPRFEVDALILTMPANNHAPAIAMLVPISIDLPN